MEGLIDPVARDMAEAALDGWQNLVFRMVDTFARDGVDADRLHSFLNNLDATNDASFKKTGTSRVAKFIQEIREHLPQDQESV